MNSSKYDLCIILVMFLKLTHSVNFKQNYTIFLKKSYILVIAHESLHFEGFTFYTSICTSILFMKKPNNSYRVVFKLVFNH